ncbi:MAG: TIR domain-containing protein [Pyrinomonadaceae bacterium]|nr:TIR domain-containing protein [Pyrinomonadaceae bacterium]
MAENNSTGYQEAVRRITEWKTSGDVAKELNLSDLQLTELPKEIIELKDLRLLYLANNQLRELPKEISELKDLQELSLENNQLSELPKEIIKLKDLQELSLENNQLSELPKEIIGLKDLRVLSLGNNQLSELPKEIIGLKDLRVLSLGNNQLSELPKEIIWLKDLRVLSLQGNVKLNIPPEIIQNVIEPQIILNYYFENVAGKDRPLNEIKMLLLGEGEVGKTALVHRLINNEFITKGKTEGIDIHKWNVEVKKNCEIQVNIWDFAGQEITHATHQFFLTKRSLYLLVLASRGDEKSNRLEEWLKVIQNLGGDSPVIIVCNKSDEHQMSLDERALREKYPNIYEIVKVSCKRGTNIKRLKQLILKAIRNIPHVFDPFSKKWFAVKERLENLRENYIPFEDYLKICKKEGVINDLDRETLIKFLHDLGVVLNFRDDRRLNDTNVLKPEWITEGVYKILTSKMLDDKHGVLSLEMVEKILDNRRYPRHKHRFIVQMMHRFQRCFPLKDEELFLVPDLLPKQQPDLSEWESDKTGLGFQYHYEIEPASFITRFIVNMNEYVDNETYWRKGVVLTNGKDNRALVKADLEDKIISIRIDGKMETRRGFFSMIRRQFDKIHETMKNLQVKGYVQHEKGLIPYDSLLKLEEKRIKKHYFPELDEEIDVNEMLNGFEDKIERLWREAGKAGYKFSSGRAGLKNFARELLEMKYDAAFSFAGEDREFVEKVYEILRRENISVFYDADADITVYLWGKDLIEELDAVYRQSSKYVVMFVSENYAEKVWTKLEKRSALVTALNEKREYILPAKFDETQLPGLLPSVGFIDLRRETPESFADKIIRKLGRR